MLGPPTKSPSFSRSICWFGSTFFLRLFFFCFVLSGEIRSRRSGNTLASYIFTVRSRYGFLDSTQVEKEETTSKGHTYTRSTEDVSLVGPPSLSSLVMYGNVHVYLVFLHPCEKPESFLRRPFSQFIRTKNFFFPARTLNFRGGWGSSSTYVISSLWLVSLDFFPFSYVADDLPSHHPHI